MAGEKLSWLLKMVHLLGGRNVAQPFLSSEACNYIEILSQSTQNRPFWSFYAHIVQWITLIELPARC